MNEFIREKTDLLNKLRRVTKHLNNYIFIGNAQGVTEYEVTFDDCYIYNQDITSMIYDVFSWDVMKVVDNFHEIAAEVARRTENEEWNGEEEYFNLMKRELIALMCERILNFDRLSTEENYRLSQLSVKDYLYRVGVEVGLVLL